VLTDRGTEYCGNPEHHEYELYLAVEDVDHSRTKTKSPQANGIAERFHKTVLDEFYRVAFRKTIYGSIAQLQGDLDQGSSATTRRGRTRADGASARRRCKPSLTPSLWQRRRLKGGTDPTPDAVCQIKFQLLHKFVARCAPDGELPSVTSPLSKLNRTSGADPCLPHRGSLSLCSRPSRASRCAMAFGHP
jgi:hypothetical protein